MLIGEKVRLITGGPTMTVEMIKLRLSEKVLRTLPDGEGAYCGPWVYCVWFNEVGKLYRAAFRPNQLAKVE